MPLGFQGLVSSALRADYHDLNIFVNVSIKIIVYVKS